MPKSIPDGKKPGSLRERVEKIESSTSGGVPVDPANMSSDEIRRMLHELKVHQIELEMQNQELRRSHEELDSSRRRLFDLYHLAPIGYCTIDENGTFIEVNLTLARLIGIEREELIGHPISSIIFREDQNTYHFHRRRLFELGERQVCELRLALKTGGVIWTRMEAVPGTDSTGDTVSIPACRMMISDITALKLAEEERGRLQSQLEDARRMESVGRLAGGVAHDFNNMLTVILGHLDMIMEELEPADPHRASLQEAIGAARRSASLTRQLLAFARKQIIDPQVLDLNDSVEGMLKMLLRVVGDGVSLTWFPFDGIWPVRMDPSQLDQILVNLCCNARDATEGRGAITITTGNAVIDEEFCSGHSECLQGEFIKLSVMDDGCGMLPETLEHLYEPFYTTKEDGQGTGLGLATVFGIVKQNNGFIRVLSERGRGTTFQVYIPRLHGELIEEDSMDRSSPDETRSDKTILLVEDEPGILKMLSMMLEKNGYRVLPASSSKSALRMADTCQETIHGLITDMIMPGMRGWDLARIMMKRYPGMGCILMSGHTDELNVVDGLDDRRITFIQKPFSGEFLLTTLRRILEEASERSVP